SLHVIIWVSLFVYLTFCLIINCLFSLTKYSIFALSNKSNMVDRFADLYAFPKKVSLGMPFSYTISRSYHRETSSIISANDLLSKLKRLLTQAIADVPLTLFMVSLSSLMVASS